jgi:hypothetical protein
MDFLFYASFISSIFRETPAYENGQTFVLYRVGLFSNEVQSGA